MILGRTRKAYFVIVFVFSLLMIFEAQFVMCESEPALEGFICPTISVVSPQNNTIYINEVPLVFVETDGDFEPDSVYSDHVVTKNSCSYRLDGEGDVFVGENRTLTELSEGSHEIVLHVRYYIERRPYDIFTEPIYFTLKITKPFPLVPVITVSTVLTALLVTAGILVYLKKYKPETFNSLNTRVRCAFKGIREFRGTKYLLVAIIILLLVVVLASHFITSPPVDDDWTMFHHDTAHTGYSDSKAPNTRQLQWVYPGGWSTCSPAVADDRVYTDADYSLCCLNATTGESLWNYTRMAEWFSSPAVAYGRVFTAAMKTVYCLNATTGEFLWSYPTGEYIQSSSPAVVDGKVYIGSDDRNVYCLNATTGDFIWSYTTGSGVRSSPAVVDGKLYIGSNDYNIYCLNATTGDFIWSYTTDDGVSSSPTVTNDRLYVGSSDNNIYCLNAENGALIWNYTTERPILSSPAVAYDRIYIGNNYNYLYCVNATDGTFLWSYWTSDWITSSPAVADGKVYVGSRDNKLYCLNAYTGEFIWNYTTDWDVNSSPAVANGKVYVGAGRKIYAFGQTPTP